MGIKKSAAVEAADAQATLVSTELFQSIKDATKRKCPACMTGGSQSSTTSTGP